MKFFRVENDYGEGPYINADMNLMDYLNQEKEISVYGEKHEEYMISHPTPYNDPLLTYVWSEMFTDTKEKYIFGFANLDKVFDWFCMDEEIEFLEKFKFHISIYEANDWYNGKWQSIARRESLVFIEKIDF
jgi:hypothetical protein